MAALIPKVGIEPKSQIRESDGLQALINKLSNIVQADVEQLKKDIDSLGGIGNIELPQLETLLINTLKMEKKDLDSIKVELEDYSLDINQDTPEGQEKIANLLQGFILNAESQPKLKSADGTHKKNLGADLILKELDTAKTTSEELKKLANSTKDADKAMQKSKGAFEVMSGTVDTFEATMSETTSALGKSSERLGEVSAESSGYLNKMTQILRPGVGIIGMFIGAVGLAGNAISGFQKKLDIGRSYGAAAGGDGMVEQLRQMHVTSLIDPASLKALGDGMSKNFNVGLGRNQKEMTRVATKQRLSERVMGKEYADGQMEAINDMKTVLQGQSPSGMMDDLTAQTSALAKTMGVSNKYALEQIKAIHENTKLITKGMNKDIAKDIEGTMQGMAAQMKEAGYTEDYIKETLAFASTAAADDDANQEATQNAILVKGVGGEGAEYAKKAYEQMGMTQSSALELMNKRAQLGFDGLDETEKKNYLEVQKVNKQAQERMYADLTKKKHDGTATEKEIQTLQVIRQKKGLQKSSETSNKTNQELLDANVTGKDKLKMNKASAESAPAVDKLLVTMQSQAGNEGKSRKELMAQLMTNMVSNGDVSETQKAAIAANLEKRKEQGMKDGGFETMEEYMLSLSEDQKQQLDTDAFTTVMGKSMTTAVADMEKGKGAGLGGVSSKELKNKVKSDSYENDRVALNSNGVEKTADNVQRKLIEANNAMERGIMDLVNSAIPYLNDAFEFLADNMKEIAAGMAMLLGGFLVFKVFRGLKALSMGTGLLSMAFNGLLGAIKFLGKGFWGLSTAISNMLIKGLKIFLNPVKWFKALLWTIKAPFSLLKSAISGIGSIISGLGKAFTTMTNVTKASYNGMKKVFSTPIGKNVKTATQKAGKFAQNVKTSPTATKIGEKIKKANPKSIMGNIKVEKKLLDAANASKIKNLARVQKLEKAARMASKAGNATKAAKATALALKVSSKVATGGTVAMKAAQKVGLLSKGMAGAAAGFTKFLGPLGVAVTLAMAAKGAYDGWNNASQLLGLNAVKSEADAIRLGAALDENGNAMRNATGEFIDENGKVIREVASNGQKFSSALGGAVESLTMGLVSASDSAKWFDENMGATWDHIGTIWDNMVAGAKKLWDDTKAIFGPAFESLKEVFDNFIAVVVGPFKAVMALFAGDTEGAKNAIAGTLKGIQGLFFSIPKFLGDAFTGVFDWFGNLGDKIAWQFTKMMWGIQDWWEEFSFSKDIVTPIMNKIIQGFYGLLSIGDKISKAIGEMIGGLMDSVYGYIAGMTGGGMILGALGFDDKEIKGLQDKEKEKEKTKKENDQIAAVSEGKTGKELISQLDSLGLGDTDTGFGDANVKQEAVNILSDKQLQSIIEAGSNGDIDLSKESKKMIQTELTARADGDKTQKKQIGNTKIEDIKVKQTLSDKVKTKAGKDGKKTITDYSEFKGKSSTELQKYLKENRKNLSKESKKKINSMIDDPKRDSDRIKKAKELTKQRKTERAENAKHLKTKVSDFVPTTDSKIDAAKVAVGGLGSDEVLKTNNAQDLSGSMGETFTNIMGKSDEIASSGFKSVTDAISSLGGIGGTATSTDNRDMSTKIKEAGVTKKDIQSNQNITQNAIAIQNTDGVGNKFATEAYAKMDMDQGQAIQLMNKRAQVGYEGLNKQEKKQYLEVQKINKQAQEIETADLSKKVNEGTATEKEIKTLQVLKQNSTIPSNTTDTLKEIKKTESVYKPTTSIPGTKTNADVLATDLIKSDTGSTDTSPTLDIEALRKLHESIIKTDGKAKDEYLKGLKLNADDNKAMLETNWALEKLKTKDWKDLKAEEKKRILQANALLNKKEKETPKGGDKTKNGNGDKNKKEVKNAVKKATEKQLVSSAEGAAMNADLKKLVGDETKKKELDAKLKEIGMTVEAVSGMAYNVETGGKQSKKSQEKLLQAKNIMAVMQGSKSQKQVDLEQGKTDRLKQNSKQFVVDKANAIHNEDLTKTKTGAYLVEKDELAEEMKAAEKSGDKEKIKAIKLKQKALTEKNPEMAKEEAYLEKKDQLAEELKAAEKGGDKEAIAKVKAKQKELEATDIGKKDKAGKLTIDAEKAKEVKAKIGIKKDIKNGKMKDAKAKTKALYGSELAENQKLESKKIEGEIDSEKQKHRKTKGYVPETKIVTGKETKKLDVNGKPIVEVDKTTSVKKEGANANVPVSELVTAPTKDVKTKTGSATAGAGTAANINEVQTSSRKATVAQPNNTQAKAQAKAARESAKHDTPEATKAETEGGNGEILKLLQQIAGSNHVISSNSTKSVSLDSARNAIAEKNYKANADRMDTSRQQAITAGGNRKH